MRDRRCGAVADIARHWSILDRAAAVDFAKRTNDEIVERYTSVHPGRLQAFATVALQSPKDAADELERAVVELGMRARW